MEDISIKCEDMSLNEIGDYFAGLMAFLSTFWLVIAFIWQAMELSFQRKEFKSTNELAQKRQHQESLWRKIDTAQLSYSNFSDSLQKLIDIYEQITLEPVESVESADDSIERFLSLPTKEKITFKHSEISNDLTMRYISRYIQTRSYLLMLSEICKDADVTKFLPFDHKKISAIKD